VKRGFSELLSPSQSMEGPNRAGVSNAGGGPKRGTVSVLLQRKLCFRILPQTLIYFSEWAAAMSVLIRRDTDSAVL
jgi:hypothetical protein